MKLQAQYNISDLIALVEQDLKNKGLHLVGNPDTNGHTDFILSLSVEQFINASLVAPEEPAALPAPVAEPVPHAIPNPKKSYKQDDNLTEAELATLEAKRARLRKAGQAKRERKAAKVPVKPDQTNALKIVAQVNTPNLPHQHDITFYLVKGFSDPDDPNHKHYTRLCKDCGWNEVAECLTCKGRSDFQGKVLGTIEEIKKGKQEVVAPAAPTFQAKESALTR